MATEEKKTNIEELPDKKTNHLDKEDLVSEAGKNIKWVVCSFCGSKVLQPNKAEYLEQEFSLPLVSAKEEEPPDSEREKLCQFWLVIDMFTFENVGFSKTVNTTKYLICADCEVGPIGLMDIEDKTKHYIALSRVKHE